jgi:FkbM family methyltransferase
VGHARYLIFRFVRGLSRRVVAGVQLPMRTNLKSLAIWGRGLFGRLPRRDVWLDVPGGSIYLPSDTLGIDFRVFREIFAARIFDIRCDGRVVIDIGAHKGYFAVFALARGALGVISYEPNSQNFTSMERTRARNERANDWVIINQAVGSCAGTAKLFVSYESWAHSLFPIASTVGIQEVPVTTLVDALDTAQDRWPSRPVVLKLNVEGAAGEILLATSRDQLLLVTEIHLDYEPWSPYVLREVLDHLASAGLVRIHTVNRREYRISRGTLASPVH